MPLPKYVTNNEVEHCRFCQWEIFPGQKIIVTEGNCIFDRPKCVEGKREEYPEMLIDDLADPKEFVFSYSSIREKRSRRHDFPFDH